MELFPFSKDIELNQSGKSLFVNYQKVIEHIGPILTEHRREVIDRVVQNRIYKTSVVLDGLHDRGNVSAVMRTAEALGFVSFHVVESAAKFKEANRVTKGADKWLEVERWKEPTSCIRKLKDQGLKIVCTSLEASVPISEIDFSVPTALVLGNERDGVSQEFLKASDARVILPMTGFVQSYNISVAASIALYHVWNEAFTKHMQRMTEEEVKVMRAHYYLRSLDSAEKTLRELAARGTI